tara:strand:+ start:5776 stop:6534 length:759 start_codon:yes stop_codon:yes gene_type:complete
MNNLFEKKYKKLLLKIILKGQMVNNRTNTPTIKLFNKHLNINLQKGFPIITGKKIFFNKALGEFKWMYEGKTDLKYLQNYNINWWNDFAINNKLGKVYGYQIRKYNNVFDQIKYVIKEIKNNSRRAIVNLWNPCDLNDQALPCCFTQMNFVRTNKELNLVVHFRSSDVFLGLPYDIIVMALFLYTIAKECNLQPKLLGLNLADAHVYINQLSQIKKYLSNGIKNLPTLTGEYNNYKLKNYSSYDYIKTPLVI